MKTLGCPRPLSGGFFIFGNFPAQTLFRGLQPCRSISSLRLAHYTSRYEIQISCPNFINISSSGPFFARCSYFLPVRTDYFFMFIGVNKYKYTSDFSRIREFFSGRSNPFSKKSHLNAINSRGHTP